MFEKMNSIKFIKKLLKFLYVIIDFYEMWYTKSRDWNRKE